MNRLEQAVDSSAPPSYRADTPTGGCRIPRNGRSVRQATVHPEQAKIYRAMSPEKRLQIAYDLYRTARQLKEAGLRDSHPDWTEEQVRSEVRRIFLYART